MKKNLTVSIAIFIKDVEAESFKVWTQVRLEEGALYGKLEFPGGKIEVGETPEGACRREVHEEVDLLLPQDEKLVLFKYQDYSVEHKNICLFVFISKFQDLPAEKGQWLTIPYNEKSASLQGKIPPINHVIIDDLAVYIKTQFEQGALQYLWQQ
ncbi:mutator protein MutT [Bacteriovorax stolpii]|uniref:NUDIX hydrolase n=1 Tax=Bacteriovorax stolpii TaxID=960 RepID=UPI0010D247C6|nr:NUDIX domain-containing protein [Bacteriovorax stolpii]TDP54294.1 mutator protein MutT [Bacteriovorax stolpii]BDT30000.1 NUDIX domain-containing protein [Bacteriovorax sp. HI3]